ncbi:unnamed protein product [Closterium sp. Yama58-4]|nr:unnamed protein product [Closterium sp. Yama58-4]
MATLSLARFPADIAGASVVSADVSSDLRLLAAHLPCGDVAVCALGSPVRPAAATTHVLFRDRAEPAPADAPPHAPSYHRRVAWLCPRQQLGEPCDQGQSHDRILVLLRPRRVSLYAISAGTSPVSGSPIPAASVQARRVPFGRAGVRVVFWPESARGSSSARGASDAFDLLSGAADGAGETGRWEQLAGGGEAAAHMSMGAGARMGFSMSAWHAHFDSPPWHSLLAACGAMAAGGGSGEQARSNGEASMQESGSEGGAWGCAVEQVVAVGVESDAHASHLALLLTSRQAYAHMCLSPSALRCQAPLPAHSSVLVLAVAGGVSADNRSQRAQGDAGGMVGELWRGEQGEQGRRVGGVVRVQCCIHLHAVTGAQHGAGAMWSAVKLQGAVLCAVQPWGAAFTWSAASGRPLHSLLLTPAGPAPLAPTHASAPPHVLHAHGAGASASSSSSASMQSCPSMDGARHSRAVGGGMGGVVGVVLGGEGALLCAVTTTGLVLTALLPAPMLPHTPPPLPTPPAPPMRSVVLCSPLASGRVLLGLVHADRPGPADSSTAVLTVAVLHSHHTPHHAPPPAASHPASDATRPAPKAHVAIYSFPLAIPHNHAPLTHTLLAPALPPLSLPSCAVPLLSCHRLLCLSNDRLLLLLPARPPSPLHLSSAPLFPMCHLPRSCLPSPPCAAALRMSLTLAALQLEGVPSLTPCGGEQGEGGVRVQRGGHFASVVVGGSGVVERWVGAERQEEAWVRSVNEVMGAVMAIEGDVMNREDLGGTAFLSLLHNTAHANGWPDSCLVLQHVRLCLDLMCPAPSVVRLLFLLHGISAALQVKAFHCLLAYLITHLPLARFSRSHARYTSSQACCCCPPHMLSLQRMAHRLRFHLGPFTPTCLFPTFRRPSTCPAHPTISFQLALAFLWQGHAGMAAQVLLRLGAHVHASLRELLLRSFSSHLRHVLSHYLHHHHLLPPPLLHFLACTQVIQDMYPLRSFTPAYRLRRASAPSSLQLHPATRAANSRSSAPRSVPEGGRAAVDSVGEAEACQQGVCGGGVIGGSWGSLVALVPAQGGQGGRQAAEAWGEGAGVGAKNKMVAEGVGEEEQSRMQVEDGLSIVVRHGFACVATAWVQHWDPAVLLQVLAEGALLASSPSPSVSSSCQPTSSSSACAPALTALHRILATHRLHIPPPLPAAPPPPAASLVAWEALLSLSLRHHLPALLSSTLHALPPTALTRSPITAVLHRPPPHPLSQPTSPRRTCMRVPVVLAAAVLNPATVLPGPGSAEASAVQHRAGGSAYGEGISGGMRRALEEQLAAQGVLLRAHWRHPLPLLRLLARAHMLLPPKGLAGEIAGGGAEEAVGVDGVSAGRRGDVGVGEGEGKGDEGKEGDGEVGVRGGGGGAVGGLQWSAVGMTLTCSALRLPLLLHLFLNTHTARHYARMQQHTHEDNMNPQSAGVLPRPYSLPVLPTPSRPLCATVQLLSAHPCYVWLLHSLLPPPPSLPITPSQAPLPAPAGVRAAAVQIAQGVRCNLAWLLAHPPPGTAWPWVSEARGGKNECTWGDDEGGEKSSGARGAGAGMSEGGDGDGNSGGGEIGQARPTAGGVALWAGSYLSGVVGCRWVEGAQQERVGGADVDAWGDDELWWWQEGQWGTEEWCGKAGTAGHSGNEAAGKRAMENEEGQEEEQDEERGEGEAEEEQGEEGHEEEMADGSGPPAGLDVWRAVGGRWEEVHVSAVEQWQQHLWRSLLLALLLHPPSHPALPSHLPLLACLDRLLGRTHLPASFPLPCALQLAPHAALQRLPTLSALSHSLASLSARPYACAWLSDPSPLASRTVPEAPASRQRSALLALPHSLRHHLLAASPLALFLSLLPSLLSPSVARASLKATTHHLHGLASAAALLARTHTPLLASASTFLSLLGLSSSRLRLVIAALHLILSSSPPPSPSSLAAVARFLHCYCSAWAGEQHGGTGRAGEAAQHKAARQLLRLLEGAVLGETEGAGGKGDGENGAGGIGVVEVGAVVKGGVGKGVVQGWSNHAVEMVGEEEKLERQRRVQLAMQRREQQQQQRDEWALVLALAAEFSLPPPNTLLLRFARANDWMGLLAQAQAQTWPLHDLVHIVHQHVPHLPLRHHLSLALARCANPSCPPPSLLPYHRTPTLFHVLSQATTAPTHSHTPGSTAARPPGRVAVQLLCMARHLHWPLLAVVAAGVQGGAEDRQAGASSGITLFHLACLDCWLHATCAQLLAASTHTASHSLATPGGAVAAQEEMENGGLQGDEGEEEGEAEEEGVEAAHGGWVGERQEWVQGLQQGKCRRVEAERGPRVKRKAADVGGGEQRVPQPQAQPGAEPRQREAQGGEEARGMGLGGMVAWLCREGCVLPLLRGLHLFLPRCSLLYLLLALQAHWRQHSEEAEACVAEFNVLADREHAHAQAAQHHQGHALGEALGDLETVWGAEGAVEEEQAASHDLPSLHTLSSFFSPSFSLRSFALRCSLSPSAILSSLASLAIDAAIARAASPHQTLSLLHLLSRARLPPPAQHRLQQLQVEAQLLSRDPSGPSASPLPSVPPVPPVAAAGITSGAAGARVDGGAEQSWGEGRGWGAAMEQGEVGVGERGESGEGGWGNEALQQLVQAGRWNEARVLAGRLEGHGGSTARGDASMADDGGDSHGGGGWMGDRVEQAGAGDEEEDEMGEGSTGAASMTQEASALQARITLTQAEHMVQEWQQLLWEEEEERAVVWEHCHHLFMCHRLPPHRAVAFFLAHACSLGTQLSRPSATPAAAPACDSDAEDRAGSRGDGVGAVEGRGEEEERVEAETDPLSEGLWSAVSVWGGEDEGQEEEEDEEVWSEAGEESDGWGDEMECAQRRARCLHPVLLLALQWKLRAYHLAYLYGPLPHTLRSHARPCVFCSGISFRCLLLALLGAHRCLLIHLWPISFPHPVLHRLFPRHPSHACRAAAAPHTAPEDCTTPHAATTTTTTECELWLSALACRVWEVAALADHPLPPPLHCTPFPGLAVPLCSLWHRLARGPVSSFLTRTARVMAANQDALCAAAAAPLHSPPSPSSSTAQLPLPPVWPTTEEDAASGEEEERAREGVVQVLLERGQMEGAQAVCAHVGGGDGGDGTAEADVAMVEAAEAIAVHEGMMDEDMHAMVLHACRTCPVEDHTRHLLFSDQPLDVLTALARLASLPSARLCILRCFARRQAMQLLSNLSEPLSTVSVPALLRALLAEGEAALPSVQLLLATGVLSGADAVPAVAERIVQVIDSGYRSAASTAWRSTSYRRVTDVRGRGHGDGQAVQGVGGGSTAAWGAVRQGSANVARTAFMSPSHPAAPPPSSSAASPRSFHPSPLLARASSLSSSAAASGRSLGRTASGKALWGGDAPGALDAASRLPWDESEVTALLSLLSHRPALPDLPFALPPLPPAAAPAHTSSSRGESSEAPPLIFLPLALLHCLKHLDSVNANTQVDVLLLAHYTSVAVPLAANETLPRVTEAMVQCAVSLASPSLASASLRLLLATTNPRPLCFILTRLLASGQLAFLLSRLPAAASAAQAVRSVFLHATLPATSASNPMSSVLSLSAFAPPPCADTTTCATCARGCLPIPSAVSHAHSSSSAGNGKRGSGVGGGRCSGVGGCLALEIRIALHTAAWSQGLCDDSKNLVLQQLGPARELAEAHERRAGDYLADWRALQSSRWLHANDDAAVLMLLDAMRWLTAAASMWESLGAGDRARRSVAQAALLGLQVHVGDTLVGLTPAAASVLLQQQHRFFEALVIANAYDLTSPADWSLLLWTHLDRFRPSPEFLDEWAMAVPMALDMLLDVAERVQHEVATNRSAHLNQLAGAFRHLLWLVPNLEERLQLATVSRAAPAEVDKCLSMLDRVPATTAPLLLRRGHGGAYMPVL